MPMKKYAIVLVLMLVPLLGFAQDADSVSVSVAKPTFCQRLMKPVKWIASNWSDYDPEYCLPCTYDWYIQLQNTTSMEWLNMSTDDGMSIKMHSKMSNKIGPYPGYSFLTYGFTVDLNALSNGLKGTKRRNEFTLSINSNLLNVDIIRRRTGGDFIVGELTGRSVADIDEKQTNINDLTDMARKCDIGSLINYDVTGININYFTNHRRYSNPAAYTNGQLQLKSAGSWIFGLGFTHQRTESDVNDVIVNGGLKTYFWDRMPAETRQAVLSSMESDTRQSFNGSFENAVGYISGLFSTDREQYNALLSKAYNSPLLQPYLFGKVNYDGSDVTIVNTEMMSFLCNGMPSVTTVDDYNIHIGYAYNWALSKRWLLGVSLIAAPGIKHIHYDNRWSMIGVTSEQLSSAIRDYYGRELSAIFDEVAAQKGYDAEYMQQYKDEVYNTLSSGYTSDMFVLDESHTRFGCDFFGRAAVVYTRDRWRAGLSANINAYWMHSNAVSITNTYGAAVLYVAYCFGHRNKMYRKGGAYYDTYLKMIK